MLALAMTAATSANAQYGSTYGSTPVIHHAYSVPSYAPPPTQYHNIVKHHIISHPYTTYHKIIQHHTVSTPYTTYHKVVSHHTVSHPYTTYHKVVHHHTVATPYTTYNRITHHKTAYHPYTTTHSVATHSTVSHPYTTYHKVYTHHLVKHPYTTYSKLAHHKTVKHPYTTYSSILKHHLVSTPYTKYHKEPVYHTASHTYNVPYTYEVPKTTYETKYSKKYSYHKCDKFQRLRYIPKMVEGNALALSMPTPAPYVAPKIIVQHHYTTNTVHHYHTVDKHHYHTNDIHHYHTLTQEPTYRPTYEPTYRPTYQPTYKPYAAPRAYPTPAPYRQPEYHAPAAGYGRNLRAQGAYDNDDDGVGARVMATASAYQPALTLNNAEHHTLHHFVASANFEARVAATAPTCPAAVVSYRGKSESKQITCHKSIPHLVKHTIQVPKTVMRPKTVTHTVTSYKEVPEYKKKYKKIPYHVKVAHHHVATHDVVTYSEVPHQHVSTHLVTNTHEVAQHHVATSDVVSYHDVVDHHVASHDVVSYQEVPQTHVVTHDVVSYQDVPEQHLATHDVVSYHDVPETHVATHDVVSYHTIPEHHVAHQVVTQVVTQAVHYHVSPVYHSTYGGSAYGSTTYGDGATADAGDGATADGGDGATADGGDGATADGGGASDEESETNGYGRKLQYQAQAAANIETPQNAAFASNTASYNGGFAQSASYNDLGLKMAPATTAASVPLAANYGGVATAGGYQAARVASAGYGGARVASAGYGGARVASAGYGGGVRMVQTTQAPITTLSQWPAHMSWSKTGNYLADQEAEFAVVKHLVCRPEISLAYKCPHCPAYVKEAAGGYAGSRHHSRDLAEESETQTVSDEGYTVTGSDLKWEAGDSAGVRPQVFHHVYHRTADGKQPADMSKYGDWHPSMMNANGALSRPSSTHANVVPALATAGGLVVAMVAAAFVAHRWHKRTAQTEVQAATTPNLSLL